MATERQIEQAFLRGVRSIVDAVQFNAIRAEIARGDFASAVAGLDIEEAAFDELRTLLIETYAQGGVNEITGRRWPVPVRWNSATPQAEQFARYVIGEHITEIVRDTRDAVRWTMGDSIAFGRSANQTALDIVGRVGPSGRREGGILGLNTQRAQWVSGFRRKLMEDPASVANNALLTATQRRLLAKGEPLTQSQINAIMRTYENAQLLSRGKAIAVTERGNAINGGAVEAWRQAAEKLRVPISALVKEWRHIGAHKHERLSHLMASGSKVAGLNTPFQIGIHSMQYPHDPMAPASEVINCHCQVRISLPRNWRELANG